MNSGTFIGKAWALKKLYDTYPYVDGTDDQAFFSKIYLDIIENHNHLINIQLDVDTKIFQCLAGMTHDLRYDTEQNRFQSFQTDNWPSILHFNGTAGECRPNFEKWNQFHQIEVCECKFD